jgi:hypothetical protein
LACQSQRICNRESRRGAMVAQRRGQGRRRGEREELSGIQTIDWRSPPLRTKKSTRMRQALNSQPSNPKPQFSILNLQPSTINPQPSTLNPQFPTLNPQPSTLNPQPSILNPQSSTLNPQPSILDPQSSISNPQPSTLNPQSSILNPQPSTLRTKKSPYPHFDLLSMSVLSSFVRLRRGRG